MSSYVDESCLRETGAILVSTEYRSTTRKFERSFRVLVFDPSTHLSLPIHVASHLLPEPMKVHSRSRIEPIDDAGSFDLALFDISAGRSDALGIAGEVCASDPTLECLFVTNDLASPIAAAAHSLGIRRIVTADQPISWWSSTLLALAELTNARRALRDAERHLPPIPSSQPSESLRALPLPEAERQFRIAYLSRLVREHGSHKRAANRAGVPYTTLCSMLKKLGLE